MSMPTAGDIYRAAPAIESRQLKNPIHGGSQTAVETDYRGRTFPLKRYMIRQTFFIARSAVIVLVNDFHFPSPQFARGSRHTNKSERDNPALRKDIDLRIDRSNKAHNVAVFQFHSIPFPFSILKVLNF